MGALLSPGPRAPADEPVAARPSCGYPAGMKTLILRMFALFPSAALAGGNAAGFVLPGCRSSPERVDLVTMDAEKTSAPELGWNA